ncbi:MAG TPA: hypothetical protein VIT44_02525 [Cyclobacteriaceae bacterium]
MATSQNNTVKTEKYLMGQLPAGDKLLFDAQLLIDPVLKLNTFVQKRIYSLVQLYGRKELKKEITATQAKIFNNPDFQERVHSIFKTP